jgi:hypothetical protein
VEESGLKRIILETENTHNDGYGYKEDVHDVEAGL